MWLLVSRIIAEAEARETTEFTSACPSSASSKGARINFANGKSMVVDGPFAETKELIAGYWIIQVKSKAEAVEWHDVGLAEDLAQDALVATLEKWPETGVPDNPGAWLMAKLGRMDDARAELERAASLTRNARERELLLSRAAACTGAARTGL